MAEIIWAVELLQSEESSVMAVSDTKSATVSDTAANFSLVSNTASAVVSWLGQSEALEF